MLNPQVAGFLEIARLRNLSRAADALHLTQPALTARLQGLEIELGTPLFERSHRGMRLTDAGRAFLPYAERAAEAL
jgi:DNA-binding transcriptional LysR family regulator